MNKSKITNIRKNRKELNTSPKLALTQNFCLEHQKAGTLNFANKLYSNHKTKYNCLRNIFPEFKILPQTKKLCLILEWLLGYI